MHSCAVRSSYRPRKLGHRLAQMCEQRAVASLKDQCPLDGISLSVQRRSVETMKECEIGCGALVGRGASAVGGRV
jgi:hypothetical protein